jgi:hypothetical protein
VVRYVVLALDRMWRQAARAGQSADKERQPQARAS